MENSNSWIPPSSFPIVSISTAYPGVSRSDEPGTIDSFKAQFSAVPLHVKWWFMKSLGRPSNIHSVGLCGTLPGSAGCRHNDPASAASAEPSELPKGRCSAVKGMKWNFQQMVIYPSCCTLNSPGVPTCRLWLPQLPKQHFLKELYVKCCGWVCFLLVPLVSVGAGAMGTCSGCLRFQRRQQLPAELRQPGEAKPGGD